MTTAAPLCATCTHCGRDRTGQSAVCRRDAPSPIAAEHPPLAAWPKVDPDTDWCGEWKERV